MNHTDKAQKYFSNNFNCSQAVFTTFATEMCLDEELALKIATLSAAVPAREKCAEQFQVP